MIPMRSIEAEVSPSKAMALPLQLRPSVARGTPRRPFRTALLRTAAIGMAVLAGSVFATIAAPSLPSDIAQFLPDRPAPSTDQVPAVADVPVSVVFGLARLMPEGDLIHVAPPFGSGDARIAAVRVSVGDRVLDGDLLATLDNAGALESARLAAEAVVAQREASLVQARENVRIARLEARASLTEARAAADAALSRLDRGKALAQRGVATVATLDDLEAASVQAFQVLARAEATLARWDTGLIETQPDVVVAESALNAARIDLDRAVNDLAKSEVRAPVSGVVLDIAGAPGERPGSDGLMTLGRTDSMMAMVEVFQTEIGRIRTGQIVQLDTAPLAGPLTGQVEHVGLLVGSQNLVSDDTAANTDARVVEVLVRLDRDSSVRAAALSNLEAVARIETGETQ